VRTPGLRFDVNCSILFTELPLLKRPEAARLRVQAVGPGGQLDELRLEGA
jgi:hypothetical protein